MKVVNQTWSKGIDQRSSVRRGDPSRFTKLQNARLQKRGQTLEGSRIEGFERIPNTSRIYNEPILSSVMFREFFVVMMLGTSTNEVDLIITNINDGTEQVFTFEGEPHLDGKLLAVEDTVYITPYNKQLNYTDGAWKLNEFISTTPIVQVEAKVGGLLEQRESYWYRARYVYRDGHKTKTGYPVQIRTTNDERSVELTITPEVDLDEEPIKIEIFRRRADEEFYLIDDTTETTYLDTGRPRLQPLDEETYVWAKQSHTQALVTDRLVLANNHYNSTENNTEVEAREHVPEPEETFFSEDFEGPQHVPGTTWKDGISGTPIAGGNVTVREGLTFYGKGVQMKYLAHNVSGTYNGSQRMEHPFQYFHLPLNDEYELSVDWYFENVFDFNTIGQDEDAMKERLMTYGLVAPAWNGIDPGTPYTESQADAYVASRFTPDAPIRPEFKDTGFPFNTGKMHGIVSQHDDTPPAGGQPPSPDEWSVRCIWIKDGNSHPNHTQAGTSPNIGPTLALYIYDQDRSTFDFGTQIPMSGFSLERLRWYTVKLYVKVNTPNERDGIADLRVYDKNTGSLMGSVRLDDLMLRGDVPEEVGLAHRLFYSTFFGGGDIRWNPKLNPDWEDLPHIDVNNGVYARNDNFVVTHNMTEPPQIVEDILPYNTRVDVYNQVRKQDGTETFYKLQDTLETDSSDTTLQVRQTEPYTPSDEFKESAIFTRYTPYPSYDVIKFNSLEVYNAKVPSIATSDLPEEEQDRPINPHVFLGWRSVTLYISDSMGAEYTVFDRDWDTDDGPGNDLFRISPGDETTDERIKRINITSYESLEGIGDNSIGQPLTYTMNTESLSSTPVSTRVYQLAYYSVLKEAIRQRKLKIRLTGTNENYGSLSSSIPHEDFIGAVIPVIGLVDKSSTPDGVRTYGDTDWATSTNNSRLYLVLESGSVFDEYDNTQMNNQEVKADYKEGEVPNLLHRFEFEIIGLTEVDGNFYTGIEKENYWLFEHDYRLKLTDYTDYQNESGILSHTFDVNEVTDWVNVDRSGWTKRIVNGFESVEFNEDNYLVTLITEEDLVDVRLHSPNQLIWSEPYTIGTGGNKIRTFPYQNSKYISEEYGEILDVQYINNILLVFCERGVNRIAVGEVLTQQASGQTYVDSSQLLNNDFWVLKNLPEIQQRSVRQYENMLFFCDGVDIWMFSDGFQNVTNGSIVFEGSIEASSIDPKNKEYRITDSIHTWAYSIELGEWMGPYTYKDATSSSYGDRTISIADARVVEHNIGNDFGGEQYDTVFESVANDSTDPTSVKLYRKFYVETQNDNGDIDFEYGKDENVQTTVQLNQMPNKNGLWNVGVTPTNNNGRYLTWRITTRIQDFILSSVGFLFNLRNRR